MSIMSNTTKCHQRPLNSPIEVGQATDCRDQGLGESRRQPAPMSRGVFVCKHTGKITAKSELQLTHWMIGKKFLKYHNSKPFTQYPLARMHKIGMTNEKLDNYIT